MKYGRWYLLLIHIMIYDVVNWYDVVWQTGKLRLEIPNIGDTVELPIQHKTKTHVIAVCWSLTTQRQFCLIPSSPCSCRPWVVIPFFVSQVFRFQGGIFNKQKCSMPGWACFAFCNSYIMWIFIYDQRLCLQIKKLSNNNAANQNYIVKDT